MDGKKINGPSVSFFLYYVYYCQHWFFFFFFPHHMEWPFYEPLLCVQTVHLHVSQAHTAPPATQTRAHTSSTPSAPLRSAASTLWDEQLYDNSVNHRLSHSTLMGLKVPEWESHWRESRKSRWPGGSARLGSEGTPRRHRERRGLFLPSWDRKWDILPAERSSCEWRCWWMGEWRREGGGE